MAKRQQMVAPESVPAPELSGKKVKVKAKVNMHLPHGGELVTGKETMIHEEELAHLHKAHKGSVHHIIETSAPAPAQAPEKTGEAGDEGSQESDETAE